MKRRYISWWPLCFIIYIDFTWLRKVRKRWNGWSPTIFAIWIDKRLARPEQKIRHELRHQWQIWVCILIMAAVHWLIGTSPFWGFLTGHGLFWLLAPTPYLEADAYAHDD